MDNLNVYLTQADVVTLRGVLDGLKKKAGEVAVRIKELEVKKLFFFKNHSTPIIFYPPGGSLSANQAREGREG